MMLGGMTGIRDEIFEELVSVFMGDVTTCGSGGGGVSCGVCVV